MNLSLTRLAEALARGGDLPGARGRYEQVLAADERLVQANPTNVAAQRDRNLTLRKLAQVSAAAGDSTAARARYEQVVTNRELLAKASPTSVTLQREWSDSLNELGDNLLAAKDLAGARARFSQSLAVAEPLAKAHPTDATAQRVLLICYVKMAEATQDPQWPQRALDLAEDLARTGRLAPVDQQLLEYLRRFAKRER